MRSITHGLFRPKQRFKRKEGGKVPLKLLTTLALAAITIGFSPHEAKADNATQVYGWKYAESYVNECKNKWGSWGASYNTNNSTIMVKKPGSKVTQTINLADRIKTNQVSGEDGKKFAPYRYYFWCEDFSKAQNEDHWFTDAFTVMPVKSQHNDARENDSKPAPRWEVVASEKSFCKAQGDNGSRVACMYVIDLAKFLDRLDKGWGDDKDDPYDRFTGPVWIQPITKRAKGSYVSPQLTNLYDWQRECSHYGSKGEFPTHYNRKLDLYKYLTYRVKIERYECKEGGHKPDDENPDAKLPGSMKAFKELPVARGFSLKGVKEIKDKNGNVTHALKGYRWLTWSEKDKKWADRGHFYVLENGVVGTDKKIQEYSKATGEGDKFDRLFANHYRSLLTTIYVTSFHKLMVLSSF